MYPDILKLQRNYLPNIFFETRSNSSFQTHMNAHEFCPHGYLQRLDGNQRRWADKDITTARQPYGSLWDAHAWVFFCLNDSCSVSFRPLEIPSSWKKRKKAGKAQTSKNVNESQISKLWPLSVS